MLSWSLLDWLDAGSVPLILVLVLVVWRVERRLFIVELSLKEIRGRLP